MRIVGGKWAGKDLVSPKDFRVRPTAEPVRAAVLDMLGPEVQEARILDLFAGTGALGIEAISRGAKSCDFVEDRPSSLHALKANIAKYHLLKKTRVFKKDVLPWIRGIKPDTYDIAFCDPPYGSRMLDRVVDYWLESGFATLLVCEHEAGWPLPKALTKRTFGETGITLYRK